MKSSKLILALWLGASSWAQTLPQKKPLNPPVEAKPNPAQTAVRPPQSSAPANPAKAQGEAIAPRQARVQTLKTPAGAQPYGGKHGKGKKAARRWNAQMATGRDGAPEPAAKGRRDPFVSPVVERIRNSATCTGSGRRCLLVGEISLHGVVRTPNGFIAVVVNGEHTYFLREHDPLADGAVERITKDAIILRERSSDVLGRPLTREVTKKLGGPAA
jgi:hypothetical protein